MGKAFWGRKRLCMLNDLALSAKYLEVKRAAEIEKDGELKS